jgi:hypothetical protein
MTNHFGDKMYSLAMCEIYMALAYIFLRFEVTNFHTVEDDLKSANDLGAPFPRQSSEGLRVKLRRLDI